MWMLLPLLITGFGQSEAKKAHAPRFWNAQDDTAIRAALADGFETSWNSHQPATAVTPDKCVDDAIFINTSGGWIKGRKDFAEMISRLHAPGGPFHDHTRRHTVEDLRFVRLDVAVAVVKTLDIRRAGVPTTGEETRGLIIFSKEDGHWKVNALENTKIDAVPVGRP
jgi:ketosteroid isomerase-like protein